MMRHLNMGEHVSEKVHDVSQRCKIKVEKIHLISCGVFELFFHANYSTL